MADASPPPPPTPSVPLASPTDETKKRPRCDVVVRPGEMTAAHQFGAKLCDLVREGQAIELCWDTSTAAQQGIWMNLADHGESAATIGPHVRAQPFEDCKLTHSIYVLLLHALDVAKDLKKIEPKPPAVDLRASTIDAPK